MLASQGIFGLFVAAALVVSGVLPTASVAAQPRKGRNCPPKMGRCPLRLGKPHALVPGVNDDWHVRSDELGDVSRIGGHLIRFPFTWATVQPDSPETWDWTVYDRIFAAARAQGLGVILEPSAGPCWAHPVTPCPPGPSKSASASWFSTRAARSAGRCSPTWPFPTPRSSPAPSLRRTRRSTCCSAGGRERRRLAAPISTAGPTTPGRTVPTPATPPASGRRSPATPARPEPPFHFAGEHTSVWQGYMNGAVESGERAAGEIIG